MSTAISTVSTARPPTAYWPLASLVRSLSRSGWGVLAGRENTGVRTILRVLGDYMDDKTGSGKCTALQLAEASQYSDRWVRRNLYLLEDLGIIVWYRGGIIEGKPAPSIFKVVKSRLVDLIKHARKIADEKTQQKAVAFAGRLAKLRKISPTFVNERHSSRLNHAELSTDLAPLQGRASILKPSPTEELIKETKAVSFSEYLASLPETSREATALIFGKKKAKKIPKFTVASQNEISTSQAWIKEYMDKTGCSYAEALGKLWNLDKEQKK